MRHASHFVGGSPALRLAVAVAATAVLTLAVSGAASAGASPPPSPTTPAVVDPCTTPVTRAIGRIVWEREEPGAQRFESESGVHLRGWRFTSTLEMDDDRLDGTTTGTADLWDASDSAGIFRGVRVIENADGRWEGPEIAITKLHDSGVGGLLPGGARFLDVWDLVGSGAYEGLSATLFLDSDVLDGDYPVVEGSVWPTDLATCDFAAMQ